MPALLLVVGFEHRHARRRHDEQIPALDPADWRVPLANGHRRFEAPNEFDAPLRHLDVFGTGEQHARTTRCAQRRGELVRRIRLDDANISTVRARFHEIGGAATHNAATDDDDVVAMMQRVLGWQGPRTTGKHAGIRLDAGVFGYSCTLYS